MRHWLIWGVGAVLLTGCKASGPIEPQPPAWLETVVVDQAVKAAPGVGKIGQTRFGTARREDQYKQWKVGLERGKCYFLSAAGTQPVQQLYLNVWDPNKDRRVKAKRNARQMVERYCPIAGGEHKIELKVTEGYGHFALGVFGKGGAPPTVVRPRPTRPAQPPGASRNIDAQIADMAATKAQGAQPVGGLFNGTADRTDWFTPLEADKCYWLFAVGGARVQHLALRLHDPQDKLITESKEHSNRASVAHCPAASGMHHFQAQVMKGEGPYKVGIYAKKK